MSEATMNELNSAESIIQEGTGEELLGPEETKTSIFGETIPTPEELGIVEDTESVHPSEDEQEEGEDQEDLEKEPEGKEKEPEKTEVPDEAAKWEEHKTNLNKALASERAALAAERQRIKDLENELYQVKNATPAQKVDPDFEVLTPDEFEELADDDPAEALKYQVRLNAHKEALKAEARQKDTEAAEKASIERSVQDSLEDIKTAIPGLYTDEEVGVKLTDFALGKGFAGEDLSILSDPATMVIPKGSSKPVPLGKAAAAFTKFVNDTMKGTDVSQLLADKEKEVTERVTLELTKKFKNPAAATNLDSVPSATNSTPETWEPKSEAEIRNMTEAEREKYLRGE